MNYRESQWNGYKRLDFVFEGKNAILVFPKQAIKGNKWLFKTEYFDAFPQFEIDMLKRGYYLAHICNTTRWCLPDDTERKAVFAEFLQAEFGLNKKCFPVGMSCGGMQAVYFAAQYPQYVAAMYLDAPVMNLLSCPCGVGDAVFNPDMYEEFVNATGLTFSKLINYRNQPIDKLPLLKAPVFLVCGDSDSVVPYHENGKVLEDFYKQNRLDIEVVIKPDCDHHPHGLEDNTPIIEFVEKYYK